MQAIAIWLHPPECFHVQSKPYIGGRHINHRVQKCWRLDGIPLALHDKSAVFAIRLPFSVLDQRRNLLAPMEIHTCGRQIAPFLINIKTESSSYFSLSDKLAIRIGDKSFIPCLSRIVVLPLSVNSRICNRRPHVIHYAIYDFRLRPFAHSFLNLWLNSFIISSTMLRDVGYCNHRSKEADAYTGLDFHLNSPLFFSRERVNSSKSSRLVSLGLGLKKMASAFIPNSVVHRPYIMP